VTRALRRRVDRAFRTLDVQAIPADRALALVMAGLAAIEQLSSEQLKEISGGYEFDFSKLTDAELLSIVASAKPSMSARRKRTSIWLVPP
jgi:hypothetical protein